MANTELTGSTARSSILLSAVGAVCYEIGFAAADKPALEKLTGILQSCLYKIARSSRAHCEHSGRTVVMMSDVFVALAEMGLDVDSLFGYVKRPDKITLPNPTFLPRSSPSKILQSGEKRSLPSYIPEHFPPLPDPHTYIRTLTRTEPVTEYEAIREKAASQKRDIERALTRFLAKTSSSTQSLFPGDNTLFPLIPCKPSPRPYIDALLFTNQIFDEKTDEKDSANNNAADPCNKEAGKTKAISNNPYLRPAKRRK